MNDRDALQDALDRLVGDGREPKASEQRRIDTIRAQLAELDRVEGFERVRALQRAFMDREADFWGLVTDQKGAPRHGDR